MSETEKAYETEEASGSEEASFWNGRSF